MSTASEILALRKSDPNLSAAELARRLNVSRERVRQILKVNGLPTTVAPTRGLSRPSQAKASRRFGSHVPPSSVGAYGEMLVCADLLGRGLDTYRSVSPSSRSDIIVASRITGKMLRVEVRIGRTLGNGRLEFNKPSEQDRYDILAVVLEDGGLAYFPDNLALDAIDNP